MKKKILDLIDEYLEEDIYPQNKDSKLLSQKTMNLLDDTANQSSKFRTKKWVEINDESRVMYKHSNQIKFKA